MPLGAVFDFVLAPPLLPRLVGVDVTQGVVKTPFEGRPRLRRSSGHLERGTVGKERLTATTTKMVYLDPGRRSRWRSSTYVVATWL